jgi:hypothetical protein
VAEWLKAHAWKVCIPKGIEGSNPSLTAIQKPPPVGGFFMAMRKGETLAGFEQTAGKPFATAEGCPKGEGHGPINAPALSAFPPSLAVMARVNPSLTAITK